MKINTELLKIIILGNNHNEIATTDLSQPQTSSPKSSKENNNVNNSTAINNNNNNNSKENNNNNSTTDINENELNKDNKTNKENNNSSTKFVNNLPPSSSSSNNNINEDETSTTTPQKQPHIPFVVTSTFVPLSSSFSPSPIGSSILSSCSPNAYSPLYNSIGDYDITSPSTSVTSTPTTGYMSPRSPTSNSNNNNSNSNNNNNTNNNANNNSNYNHSQTSPQSTLRHHTYKPPNHHRLKQRTLFEKLYTESGFASAKAWYERNTQQSDFTMGESQFLLLLRHLTDFSTFHVLDLFDALDRDDIGVVGFEEFFLLIALYASRECGQTTKFLYQHSRVMFEIMAAAGSDKYIADNNNNNSNNSTNNNQNDINNNSFNKDNSSNSKDSNNIYTNKNTNNNQSTPTTITEEPTINFHSFTKFAKIIGIPEYQVLNSLERFNIVIFDQINFEMFLLYYFVILDEWDRSSYPFLKILYHDPDYSEPIVQRSGTGTVNDDNAFVYANEDDEYYQQQQQLNAKPKFSDDFLAWLDSSALKLDERHKHYLKSHLLQHHIVNFEIAETITEEDWQDMLDKATTRKIFLKALQEKLIRLRTPPKRPLLSRKLFNFQSSNHTSHNNNSNNTSSNSSTSSSSSIGSSSSPRTNNINNNNNNNSPRTNINTPKTPNSSNNTPVIQSRSISQFNLSNK